MKDFEYAKKKNAHKRKRRWWVVSCGRYEVYLWALPLYPLFLLSEKIKDWQYERLVFTEERANRVLDYALPRVLEYIAEEDAYYFNTCWNLGKKNVPWHLRAWTRKFHSKLIDFLIDTYQKDGYKKEYEKDYFDNWVKFTKED